VRNLGRTLQLAERFHADLERPLGELSRGSRQKIGLIQAFFHSPELLILDEPTGGLDPLMQEEFLDLVREEREHGASVFLSSHKLDEVQRVCDRVGIIRNGRLVAVEKVAELIGRAYRHVSLEFDRPIDASEFRRFGGVSELVAAGNGISFRAEGDLDEVVKAAARHTVRDLQVTEPTLDEIFLTYYAKDGAP
jgi:ABC-2 type transport system ATP-binding protein